MEVMVKNEMTKNKEIKEVIAETLYPIPGDIVSLGTHYGVYIGHGQMIHYPRHTDSIRKDFLTKLGQNGFIAFSINREAPESETKPLPADEIVQRAESMLGKTKAELTEINSSRDFANWCRYSTTAPMIIDASFEAPKVIANQFICRTWNEKGDKVVSTLDIEEIRKEVHIAFEEKKEARRNSPEFEFFNLLFGLPSRSEDSLDNYYLVCLREKTADNGYMVASFLVDMRISRHVITKSVLVWQTEWLDEDLQQAFGNRNMCIIQ